MGQLKKIYYMTLAKQVLNYHLIIGFEFAMFIEEFSKKLILFPTFYIKMLLIHKKKQKTN
jgi:hypothetical protein